MPVKSVVNTHRTVRLLCAATVGVTCANPVHAREGLDLSVNYVADFSALGHGGSDRKVRYLENLELGLDADLQKLWKIRDTTIHVSVLGNFGARPNDNADTLQGTDNIEVGRSAVRLFEAWAERSFGKASIRAGLYDLNSEFNATPSAGLLIAPPFGIGSELAATGRNGPSIFPSSALAVRFKAPLPGPTGYVQIAVVNAKSQTLGDRGGIDLSFEDGLLTIAEAGIGERLRAALGIWRYTRRSEALASFDAEGRPAKARTRGAYAMLEFDVLHGGSRAITAFLRGGLSRGKSNPFDNSLQGGVLMTPAIKGRDASALSLGYHQAYTSREFRKARAQQGEVPWRRERGIEVTFSDAVNRFITAQPDVQWIEQQDDAERPRRSVQATMRITLSF